MAEEKQGGDEFTAEEQAYFQSGGESDVPAEEHVEETTVEAEDETAKAAEPASEEQEEGTEGQERDEKGRFVPHGAFHAERERRKEIEGRLNEMLQKQAVLEERWKSFQKPAEEEQKDEDPEPDPNKDIFAHNAWLKRQFERERQANAEFRDSQQKTQQQVQQEQQISQTWNQSVQQFSQQEPAFQEGAQYLLNVRTQQLKAFGMNDAQINQTIDKEVKDAVAWAMQNGKNPAQVVFEYAKASGFTPQQKQQADPNQLPDNLKRVAEAQNSAKTIATGGGKTAAEPDSPQAIADMSPKEFEAWIAKPENERRFQKMMGA